MKKGKMLALLLALSMVLSQTAWAAEGSGTADTGQEAQEQQEPDRMPQEDTEGTADSSDLTEEEPAPADTLEPEMPEATEPAAPAAEEEEKDTARAEQYADPAEVEIPWDDYSYDPMMDPVYMELPRIETLWELGSEPADNYVVAVEDPDICQVEKVSVYEGTLYAKFTGKKAGSTRILIYLPGEDGLPMSWQCAACQVEVKEKPADAADISDPAMNYALIYTGYSDWDHNGYISTDELQGTSWFSADDGANPALHIQDWSALAGMEHLSSFQVVGYEFENLDFLTDRLLHPDELTLLNLIDCTVQDYSGLSAFTELGELGVAGNGLENLNLLQYVNPEYLHTLYAAENNITDLSPLAEFDYLNIVRMSGNPDLQNIDVLMQLDKLTNVNLDNTAVTDQDRWELENVPETISMTKNQSVYVPPIGELLDMEGLSVQIVSGEEYVSVEEDTVGKTYSVKGLRTGTAVLEVSYKDTYRQNVTVDVSPVEPEEYTFNMKPGETNSLGAYVDLSEFTCEVDQPDVCSAELDLTYDTVDIKALAAGTAEICVMDPDGDVYMRIHVTVEDWPAKTVYIGQNATLSGVTFSMDTEDNFEAEVEDPSICHAEIKVTTDEVWNSKSVDIKVEGLKEGTTMVYMKWDGRIMAGYRVTVRTLPEDAVVLEDPGLMEALLGRYGGADANQDGYISKDEFLDLDYIDLGGYDVKDLSGLAEAKNLTSISITNSGLENLDLFTAELPTVRNLYLYGNNIKDLTGLKYLPNLQTLELTNNGLTDLGLLTTADLSKLIYLNLQNNQIQSLASLKDVKAQFSCGCTNLSLAYNPLESLEGLELFQNLSTLIINSCDLTGLDLLENVGTMDSLSYLQLQDNHISELTGIEKFPHLESLDLSNNELTSLEGIDVLPDLTALYCSDNKLTDMQPIGALKHLQNLTLSRNQIASMKGLGGQDSLESVDLQENDLVSLEGMGELPALTLLDLGNNGLTSITGISKAPRLTSLRLNGNNLSDVSEIGRLTNLYYLSLSDNQVTDISGFENLSGLNSLDLDGNQGLTDLTPLTGLKNLLYVNVDGTGVTQAERWKLAGFEDIHLMKGQSVSCPEAMSGLFQDMTLTAGEDAEGIIEVTKEYSSYNIKGIGSGTCHVTAAMGEDSKEFTVTVTSMEDLQPAGEPYENAAASTGTANTILDSNSNLWSLYPEVKKLGSDVKGYVSSWIYHNQGGENYSYILKNDDTVWTADGQTKLAENVARVSGRYALQTDGTLVNLLNTGNEKIEGVKDWYVSLRNVYILKEDGTLWTRVETPSDQAPETLTRIAEGVRDLAKDQGYILTDGTLVSFAGTVLATNVSSSPGWIGYYDNEGYFYFNASGVYIKLGQFTFTDYIGAYVDGVTYYYYLQEDGTLYRSIGAGGLQVIAEHVTALGGYDDNWIYQTEDGVKYDAKGNPVDAPALISIYDEQHRIFRIVQDGSSTVLERSGVQLLSDAVNVWGDGSMTYCLRTDGTIWDVTDLPKQVASLAELEDTSYLRGDVTQDGTVDISDLRLVLRYVCRKVTLDDTQKTAGDVTDDGTVDIQDLRKILRFVCKKITEL